MKAKFNEEVKTVLDELLLQLPGVTAGKMFGYPAYYLGRRMFACVYGNGVGVKVPEDLARSLLTEKDIVPFQPMGRSRMREWVQINRSTAADYRNDMDVFRTAIDFARTAKAR